MEQIIEYFHYNSYVTLTYFFASLAVLILNTLTFGAANKYVFSTEKKSFLNPMTYIRMFTHVLGHSDWNHFSGNFLKILLLGPLIEEKYGSIESNSRFKSWIYEDIFNSFNSFMFIFSLNSAL